MTLICQTDPRRDAVRSAANRNGLDYVEVDDGPPVQLTVFFLGKLPPELATKKPGLKRYLQISGGERITGLSILDVTPVPGIDAQHDDSLRVTLDVVGDFSTYTLSLVGVEGIDPKYVSADFRFRIDCASDLDCGSSCTCAPEVPDEPNLNYLAKDYASFRQLIFDRMATLVPDWTERHVPDLGVTLVELLAYVGDSLSYYQDAVATEAYLGTARQRITVRRHARLVDYQMHEGCNARTWVHVKVGNTLTPVLNKVSLPASRIAFATQIKSANGALPSVVDVRQLQDVPANTYEYFEPLLPDPNRTLEFRDYHNRISIYTWGRRRCCLEKDSTSATLADTWLKIEGPERGLRIQVGDVLIFQEVRGPKTGDPADADPAKRWAVRVKSVTLNEDPLYPIQIRAGDVTSTRPTPLVEISWSVEDALPFTVCLSTIGAAPDCRYHDDVTIVKGNIVPVDHGRHTGPEPLGPVPGVVSPGCCECEGQPADVVSTAARFRPVLQKTPLTYRDPVDPSALAASLALRQDPRQTLPAVSLNDVIRDWSVKYDLLESGAEDPDFVVEVDNDGVSHLRFGDGNIGRIPDVGSIFAATYRYGCGVVGNVAAEAIVHLILTDFKLDGVTVSICNPLRASGGIDPESMAEAKMFAPGSFRDPAKMARAIAAADYATLAKRDTALQGASAQLAWTGSWYEADVSVDPLLIEVADKVLLDRVEGKLHRYRRMGHDLRVQSAVYVPIELEIAVCARPGYDRGHVKAALLARFSNRLNCDGSRGYFHPDNLQLGEDLFLSPIIAAAQAIAGVQSVTVKTLQRLFEPANHEIANGILPIANNEIAQLDNDPDFPERGQLKISVGGGR